METGFLHVHNLLRWAVLIFGLLTLVAAMRGLGGKKDFVKSDQRMALFLLISCDVQLLLGLALYFMKGYQKNFSGGVMGEVMKNSVSRFWTIEHGLTMILGIILIHIGYAGTKGAKAPVSKFRRLFWCTLVALILFAAMIPWPGREGIGRALFPGM